MKLLPNQPAGNGKGRYVWIGGDVRMWKNPEDIEDLYRRGIAFTEDVPVMKKNGKEFEKGGHSDPPRTRGRDRREQSTGRNRLRPRQSGDHTPVDSQRSNSPARVTARGRRKTGGYVFTEADARKGGQKGGQARRHALTKAERIQIARTAARARWKTRK